MEVNRTFKSYNDFEAYRAEYERDTKQVFIKGPSSKKFGIGEDERDTIVYKAVTFNCVYGKDRASESTGNRPFQHTKKTGCPLTFKVNGYQKTGTLSVRIAPDILQHTRPQNQMLEEFPPPKPKERIVSVKSHGTIEFKIPQLWHKLAIKSQSKVVKKVKQN